MDIICYACGKEENPENSIPGIEHSLKINPDWRIEMDLQITADDQIVLMHDTSTLRTTGEDHQVSHMNYADLQSLAIGHDYYKDVFLKDKSDLRIPLLKDVLALYPKINLILDLSSRDLKMVDLVKELIEDLPKSRDIILVSAYDHIIERCKNILPDNRTAAATKEAKQLVISSKLRLDRYFELKSDFLMIPEYLGNVKILSPRLINHVHARGKKVYVWKQEAPLFLVNDIEDIHRYRDMGVDGVFTSKPASISLDI